MFWKDGPSGQAKARVFGRTDGQNPAGLQALSKCVYASPFGLKWRVVASNRVAWHVVHKITVLGHVRAIQKARAIPSLKIWQLIIQRTHCDGSGIVFGCKAQSKQCRLRLTNAQRNTANTIGNSGVVIGKYQRYYPGANTGVRVVLRCPSGVRCQQKTNGKSAECSGVFNRLKF